VDAVGAEGDFFVAVEVAVGDMGGVEVGDEVGEGGYTEGEVQFHGVVGGSGGAGDYVQLLVGADAIPDMFVVLEGVRDALEAHDFFVEGGAFLEVLDVDGGVVEFGDLGGRSGLGKEKCAGEKSDGGEGESNGGVVHAGILHRAGCKGNTYPIIRWACIFLPSEI